MATREKAEFTKLSDGSWGIKIRAAVKTGDTVVTQRKDGKTAYATVGEILSTGDVTVARIQS